MNREVLELMIQGINNKDVGIKVDFAENGI
jgi:ATP/maltotriose-dependent transcriptional regulator MalT